MGSRTDQYLYNLQRYQLSRNLVISATEYERNWIRNFTNCIIKKLWRHKANYGLKAVLAASFIYGLSKANEANSLYTLKTGKAECNWNFYKGTVFSFGLLAGSVILI